MSVSVSTGSVDIDSVEELTRIFGQLDVVQIVDRLLAIRASLTRDAPETVYTWYQDNLAEVWTPVKQPFKLLLQLLNQPELIRRPGEKVDLMVLLVRSLKRRQRNDNEGADDEKDAPIPDELTPELTAEARQLCLRDTYLTPRTFEALVSLYRIQLTESELLAYANKAFKAGNYRDAADFIRAFRIESEQFPHMTLLAHLVNDKQCMDVFVSYLSQSPEFLQRYVHRALTHLAEYPRPDATPADGPPGGNDPNLAAKLALKFGFPLKQFPRIIYLKVGDVLWWICRINKAGEFGQLLCADDRSLQKKLLKELMKSRNPGDHFLACSFLEKWQSSFLRDSPDHQQFYQRTREIWMKEKDTYMDAEALFMLDLNKAIALSDSTPTDPNAQLLLPALPANAALGQSLPQLFLKPDAIIMVDSLETLAIARQYLINDECRMIGIDLEHLPENIDGLNFKPTLCQLLQISCKTKVFLFDLQCLHIPTEDEAKPVVSSSSTSTTTASSSSSQQIEPVFPDLPPFNPTCTPTTPELATGISDLLLELFIESDLLKVGIGFAQDIRKLRRDFSELLAFQVTLQNYVELTPLLRLVPDPDAEERDARRKQATQNARTKATARKAASKAKKSNNNDTPPNSATPSPPLPDANALLALPDGVDTAASSTSSSATPLVPRTVVGYTHHSKKEGGLLKLVRIILRRHLDKSEQISNWSKRPLSIPQMQYAALDAYTCILILEEVNRQGIELESENIESSNV